MVDIQVIEADITTLKVDAIVNAANSSLCGGGGVDGAIHRAAGGELLEECRQLRGCDAGFAKVTLGYALPAKHIIHAVGPVWYGGDRDEAALLASCYRECLKLAVQNNVQSIAFPAISCGAYRFPIDKACHIALFEVLAFCDENASINKVVFACFESKIARAMQTLLSQKQ
jgi:O-acetyl-ADP-ribose deacetylase (regulator of RNase III)